MIPVNDPVLADADRAAVLSCLEQGWISSEGPFVERFEQDVASVTGRRFGVAVCNGTVALELAVCALGLGPGDEVILPSFTIVSCALAIVRAGAVPVVVDSDACTWNMDPAQVAAAVTSRTRAIMVVHTYGLPCDMDPLLALAERHGLAIIEDAAEMLGQAYRGRPCGSFGSLSTFSFYANKTVTTGEGGMVVTDDPALAERCRTLRNLGFRKDRRFVHDELAWNFRIGSMQAALGSSQLARLPEIVAAKRRIGRSYDRLLEPLADVIQLPCAAMPYAESLYWVYGVLLGDVLALDADRARDSLGAAGIGTRPFFWPMHEQPVFRGMGLFEGVKLPVSERLARRGFYLPSGLGLSEAQVATVAAAVKRLVGR